LSTKLEINDLAKIQKVEGFQDLKNEVNEKQNK
jgi:hypothetical protein